MLSKESAGSERIYLAKKEKFTITHKLTVGEPGTENFCVEFDPDDKYFAVGSSDSRVHIFNTLSGKRMALMPLDTEKEIHPITALCWRPQSFEGKSTNIIAAVSTSGDLKFWHATTGKNLYTIKGLPENDLYCIDYRKDGNLLAVAGISRQIHIYDDIKKLCTCSLTATATAPGHSNRICAVKFTDDPNILISGGWDNTIFIWDLREEHSVGSFFGPHIWGHSIAVHGDQVLTGSYDKKDVLQLWSIGERKLISNIPWLTGSTSDHEHGYLYSAVFDKAKTPRFIAAGGSCNECRIFKSSPDYDIMAKICLTKTITSIDFAHNHFLFALTGGDGLTRLYTYEEFP